VQIYVFVCNHCGAEFGELIYSPLQLVDVKCPQCECEDVEVIDIVSHCSPFG